MTPRQFELLSFLHERIETTGIPPTFREMANAVGLKSTSNIFRLLNGLAERGYVSRLYNRNRAIEILKVPSVLRRSNQQVMHQ